MKSVPRVILFFLGLAGLTASGVWFLREGGPEPIVAEIAAAGALCADFFLNSKSELSRPRIARARKDELQTMARDLQVSGFSSLTKAELQAAILKARASNRRRRWNVAKWSGVGAALLAIPILDAAFPPRTEIFPDIALAWYTVGEQGLELADPNNVQITIGGEEILSGQVRLPLHIAISNRGGAPLKVVRVELSYEKDINVESSGSARIDPSSRTIIYEHEIGTLESIYHFTPLETVDTVAFEHAFFVSDAIALTADKVPLYSIIFTDEGFLQTREIPIGIRVLCENRPPVVGQIVLHMSGSVSMITDFDNAEPSVLTQADHLLFASTCSEGTTLDQWHSIHVYSGRMLDYRKAQTEEGICQVVKVDELPRKLILDEHADGFADYALIDSDEDGKPDLKVKFEKATPMLDWRMEAAQ